MGRGWRKWGREGRPSPRTSSNRSAGRGSASCSRGREAWPFGDLPRPPRHPNFHPRMRRRGEPDPKSSSYLGGKEGPQLLQPGDPARTPSRRVQTPAASLSPTHPGMLHPATLANDALTLGGYGLPPSRRVLGSPGYPAARRLTRSAVKASSTQLLPSGTQNASPPRGNSDFQLPTARPLAGVGGGGGDCKCPEILLP